jgi:hypothetical protein
LVTIGDPPITQLKITKLHAAKHQLAWILVAFVLRVVPATSGGISAGPLVEEFSLTLDVGKRVEAGGPFFGYERKGEQRQWVVAPLCSYTVDDGTETAEFDLAYPFLTYDRFGTEYRLQFFQLLNFSGGRNQRDDTVRRITVFPFYFQQRSPDPNLNYTALVPIYGKLKNRLFRDEIRFIAFPLYGQSRKRDVVTDNYLYPFFHLRRGEALHGWQFWPLVGYEEKNVTSITNRYDEPEIVGGHKKLFVLWPFFFNHKTAIGTTNPQTQRVLLPLYSLLRSPNRDSSTYLWPFFTFTEDREKKYRELGAPWPLIDFARGEGKTANRVWPLFSHARNPILQSDFFLWPLYKYNRAHAAPLDRERTRILFFLYSDLIEKNEETGTSLERTDLWPLFTARRDHNGNERLQLLAPIEPLLPNNKSIERNYSPLWSIWRSERNRQTGAASQSLLWNLYRRDTTPQTRKCSLLFGLFQYQSSPAGNRLRLLYLPVFKKSPAAPAQP